MIMYIFQTILEQQRVIRRLLRKSLTDTNTGATNVNNPSSICRVIEDILPDNCFTSDPEDENDQGDTGEELLK